MHRRRIPPSPARPLPLTPEAVMPIEPTPALNFHVLRVQQPLPRTDRAGRSAGTGRTRALTLPDQATKYPTNRGASINCSTEAAVHITRRAAGAVRGGGHREVPAANSFAPAGRATFTLDLAPRRSE